MKKSVILILLLLLFSTGICSAAIEKADFTVNGVNFVTGTHDDIVAHFGTPKSENTEDEQDPPMTYIKYTDIYIWLNKVTGHQEYFKFEVGDLATTRGVKIGATSYKVIKEYGPPEKSNKNGHIYYIYRLGTDPSYKLVFDLTNGYVNRIIYSKVTDLP